MVAGLMRSVRIRVLAEMTGVLTNVLTNVWANVWHSVLAHRGPVVWGCKDVRARARIMGI